MRLADPVGIDRATLLELRGQLEATAEGQAAQGEPSVWRLYLDAKEFVGDINGDGRDMMCHAKHQAWGDVPRCHSNHRGRRQGSGS